MVLLADGRLAGELLDPTVESVTNALAALSAPGAADAAGTFDVAADGGR